MKDFRIKSMGEMWPQMKPHILDVGECKRENEIQPDEIQ